MELLPVKLDAGHPELGEFVVIPLLDDTPDEFFSFHTIHQQFGPILIRLDVSATQTVGCARIFYKSAKLQSQVIRVGDDHGQPLRHGLPARLEGVSNIG